MCMFKLPLSLKILKIQSINRNIKKAIRFNKNITRIYKRYE